MSDALSPFKAMAAGVIALTLSGAFLGDSQGSFNPARLKFWKTPIAGGPSTPSPSPRPTPTPTPTTTTTPELTMVPSNFDINTELVPTWGSGEIPVGNAPDIVGAFRFICSAGQISRDDPIVYPGQPGASHLHQFFGNLNANASSNYNSLRQSGQSTCMSPLNRSAYWMPAMLDGAGSVVRPDYVSIYYKRRPASDPKCSLTSGDPQAEGNCIGLPNGLRYIMGYNMANPAGGMSGALYNCAGQTGTPGHYGSLVEAAAHCPSKQNPDGSYNQIAAGLSAPDCWDGKNLDSPNHRDHMAYAAWGSEGYQKCPSTHPYLLPAFTMIAWYRVDANLGTWHLSSDEMVPGAVAGTTLHADWFGAWDNQVEAMWLDNCINKMLNCSGGDLGNGKQMKLFSGFSLTASPHLVPIPGAVTTKVLVTEGDSISITWGGNYTGIYAGARQGKVTQIGSAVSGSGIDAVTARADAVIAKHPQYVTVLIGANDLADWNSSSTIFLDKLYAYASRMRANGIKVAIGTVLPQYLANRPDYMAVFLPRRAEVNASLRASVGTKFDALVDFAADPVMGPDSAALDTTLFMDGLHPTDGCGMGCGGQGRLAAIYAPVVDRMIGVQ